MKFSEIVFLEGGGLGSSKGAERIKKEDIDLTFKNFCKNFKKLTSIDISNSKFLGSVGKKETSGDIDCALSKDVSKKIVEWLKEKFYLFDKHQQFLNRMKDDNDKEIKSILNFSKSVSSPFNKIKNLYCVGFKIDDSSPLMINFVFSQFDNTTKKENGKMVQIDLNFGNVDWLSFVYNAELENNQNSEREIKGMHRTQLIKSIINNLHGEHTFAFQKGFKINNSLIEDKDKLIELISNGLGVKVTESDLKNYTSIIKVLKQCKDRKLVKNIFEYFLNIINSEKPINLKKLYIPTKKDFGL